MLGSSFKTTPYGINATCECLQNNLALMRNCGTSGKCASVPRKVRNWLTSLILRCSSMGKLSMDRVRTLLRKLDSVRRSEERRSKITEEAKDLSHKFMGQVEQIFKKLPKPLEWRSFYNNDLPLLMDFCEEIRDAYLEHHLNKFKSYISD